jgi:hypothetical protein
VPLGELLFSIGSEQRRYHPLRKFGAMLVKPPRRQASSSGADDSESSSSSESEDEQFGAFGGADDDTGPALLFRLAARAQEEREQELLLAMVSITKRVRCLWHMARRLRPALSRLSPLTRARRVSCYTLIGNLCLSFS